ncbi:hypothetical protein H175_16p14 (plasmid) [Bacillus thuringiensis serovar thuringiensis str. IS5056]|nr:hypothetical protein H175_16p14 [Bacillus thuringiensis serovar thuringiensis str. IS5056]
MIYKRHTKGQFLLKTGIALYTNELKETTDTIIISKLFILLYINIKE